jgi:hypothetical protein
MSVLCGPAPEDYLERTESGGVTLINYGPRGHEVPRVLLAAALRFRGLPAEQRVTDPSTLSPN